MPQTALRTNDAAPTVIFYRAMSGTSLIVIHGKFVQDVQVVQPLRSVQDVNR